MLTDLKGFLCTRTAEIVRRKLAGCNVYHVSQLRGKHIPAHFGSDQKHFASKSLSLLEKWLNKHGAVLVR